MKKRLIMAALAGAALFATPVSAATLTIGDGATGCESINNSIFNPASCDVGGNTDLSNDIRTPDSIVFEGTGFLNGFLADAGGLNANQYPDYANVTLAGPSNVTITLVAPDPTFDATFTFGDIVPVVLTSTSQSYSFVSTGGTFLFGLTATAPFNNPDKDSSSYSLSVASIAAVPLPASGLMLLAGLGGLAIARRKTRV